MDFFFITTWVPCITETRLKSETSQTRVKMKSDWFLGERPEFFDIYKKHFVAHGMSLSLTNHN